MNIQEQLGNIFPTSCCTDSEVVATYCVNVEWRSADAQENLNKVVRNNSEKLWFACCALANVINRTPLVVLRNALVRRQIGDLKESAFEPHDRIKHFYSSLVGLANIIPDPNAILTILEDIPNPPKLGQSIRAAMDCKWPPSRTLLQTMLKGQPVAYASAVVAFWPPSDLDNLIKRIGELAKLARNDHLEDAISIIIKPLRGRRRRLTLDRPTLDSLPRAIRRTILGTLRIRTALLKSHLLRMVDNNPLAHPDDPRALGYLHKLQTQISKSLESGNLNDEVLIQFAKFDWKCFSDALLDRGELLSAFKDAIENTRTLITFPEPPRGPICPGWPSSHPATTVLKLILTKQSRWASQLRALSVKQVPTRWIAGFILASPKVEQARIVRSLIKNPSFSAVQLDDLLSHVHSAVDVSTISLLVRRSSPKARQSWIGEASSHQFNGVITHNKTIGKLCLAETWRGTTNSKTAYRSLRQDRTCILDGFPPNHWHLLSSGSRRLQRYIGKEIALAIADNVTVASGTLARCLVLSPTEFLDIIRLMDSNTQVKIIGRIIECSLSIPTNVFRSVGLYDELLPGLMAYLGKHAYGTMDRPLLRLLLDAPPNVKTLAIDKAPNLCLPIAKRILSDQEFLSLAFRFSAYRPEASQRLSRCSRQSLIPWAQTSDGILESLARELSLAFSLEQVESLRQLSYHWVKRIKMGASKGRRFDDLYNTYTLPKRSGGVRTICSPSVHLKLVQDAILRQGLEALPVHDAAHGFRRGRSIVTNAEVHVRRPIVVNVDIRGFFPNTRFVHIYRSCALLAGGSLTKRARFMLADLCSYDGGLPIGAPTSPAIGNLVLRSADASISKAAKRYDITYTRYADDLTFSGGHHAPAIIPFVEKVLADFGYELDPKKRGIFRKGRQQPVTGLIVNEKVNITRRTRRRMRAAVHRRTQSLTPTWHGKPMSDRELIGRLAFLNMVQPREAHSLRSQLKTATTVDHS